MILNIQAADIPFRHRIQPDCLPDTGHGRVPHSSPLQCLLAVRHHIAPQIIGHTDDDLIVVPEKRRNIKAHGLITAQVMPRVASVDIYIRFLVRRADVQQYPAPVESRRKNDIPPVPQAKSLFKMLPDTGKPAFRAERNQYFFVIFTGFFPGCRKVPHSVQIQPVLPAHLGLGVILPGCDIPPGQQPLPCRCQHFNTHRFSPSSVSGPLGSARSRSAPQRAAPPGRCSRWG